MDSEQKNLISEIRSDFFQANPRVKDSLNNSIQTLATDLYNKDTHFIFELIQNAEDNAYGELEPSLFFYLAKHDPTNSPDTTGALIIQNNEVGFSSKNVSAICAVGKTTKSKMNGYIGEKGIGFKSVFRVTSIPHIFSKGYWFCLPELDKETGFRYIVPQWISPPPNEAILNQTTIILPLDKDGFGYERIEQMLKELRPETILFLSKIKRIKIETDTGYKLSISKDDSEAPFVQLLIEGERDSELISESLGFLLYTQNFDKPKNVKQEKREGINTRDVSIAFPLGEGMQGAGKVFAYLPLELDSGLPFVINADFILTSSREDFHRDNPWNQWLRDCVTTAFVNAFAEWVDIERYRARIFAFIPLQAHIDFLKPIVQSIQNELKNCSVIPTEPEGHRFKPEQSRMAYKNFRSLLSVNAFPRVLLETPLVLGEIEEYEDQLKSIGVTHPNLEFVKKCLLEREWVEKHDLDWLLKCFKYLSTKNFKTINLKECPIVPVDSDDKRWLTCEHEQPIYFECDEDCESILQSVPDNARVHLAFLAQEFLEKVKEEEGLSDWMTESLGIYHFSKTNYASDVFCWLKSNFEAIPESDLISVTAFLAQFVETNIDFSEIPVLLSDGRRLPLDEVRNIPEIQVVATPEVLDPETGWQNIFITQQDRQHIASLSDSYITLTESNDDLDLLKSLWHEVEITEYPLPNKVELPEYHHSVTPYEKRCINRTDYSTRTKQITNYRPISWFQPPDISEDPDIFKKTNSFIHWLNHQSPYQAWKTARVKGFYYSQHNKNFTSELLHSLKECSWLPTTKGLVRPNQAFLSSESIKEILGDTVPYFEGNLPDEMIHQLGIRRNATAEELVSILEQYSRNEKGTKEFSERVYRTLASRDISDDLIARLRQGRIIFVLHESDPQWVSSENTIWKDQSTVLGDDFIYLEKIYPKLRDFFVNIMQVKEDVDPEIFARQWLKLQEDPGRDHKEIEKSLTAIYREIRLILLSDGVTPEWWQEFVDEAQIWTQDKIFVDPRKVYVPDDGEIKQIFQGNGLSFAWRPEKDSFSDWEVLFRALGLPYLSESISISLLEKNEYTTNEQPTFLTDACKILIATWIREARNSDYQRLIESDLLEILFKTDEARVPSVTLLYRIGTKKVEKDSDAFWNKADPILLIPDSANSKTKNAIARALARELMKNRPYKDLAVWIELILGEEDGQWRIQREGWQVPDKIKKMMLSMNQEMISDETDLVVLEAEITLVESSEETKKEPASNIEIDEPPLIPPIKPVNALVPTSQDREVGLTSDLSVDEQKEKFDYLAELIQASNRQGATQLIDSHEPDNWPVINPDRRREKEAEDQHLRISYEPDSVERRKKTERTILEGPDEMVRATLGKWYGGKCQICNRTFPERSGRPFFVATYIVPRKLARQIDTYANAFCLCAEHFAKWQHGAVEIENIIEQINLLKLPSENGDGNLQIQIKLCGENCTISFNEKHVIAFQELLTA
jgi:hypothetical protein